MSEICSKCIICNSLFECIGSIWYNCVQLVYFASIIKWKIGYCSFSKKNIFSWKKKRKEVFFAQQSRPTCAKVSFYKTESKTRTDSIHLTASSREATNFRRASDIRNTQLVSPHDNVQRLNCILISCFWNMNEIRTVVNMNIEYGVFICLQ